LRGPLAAFRLHEGVVAGKGYVVSQVVGVDLGGTNIKVALVDDTGRVAYEDRCPTTSADGPSAVCARIAQLVDELLLAAGLNVSQVLALGIGAPGPLDSRAGLVLRCPNMPGWENFPLSAELTERCGLPVHLENDANASALAEAWIGAGRGKQNVVCITLGTGVGSGVVAGGRLLKGRGLACELGHMIVHEGGRLCGCGARGCFEAYASATAVVKRACEALLETPNESPLAELSDITCKDVFDAALEGDAIAVSVIDGTARYLAAGMASIVHVFHPDVIVLTGGMIAAGEEALLRPAVAYLEERAMAECLAGTAIELSELRDRAGILGAAAVALVRSGVLDLTTCD